MADIRINSLPTTASASSSDDFLALDGATNGTRKLNAYSPTFGGNLTVSGTGTSGISGSLMVGSSGYTPSVPTIGIYRAATSVPVVYSALNNSYGWSWGMDASSNYIVTYNGGTGFGTTALTLANTTGNATLTGNLTVSGTGTSSVGGNLQIGTTGSTPSIYSRDGIYFNIDSNNDDANQAFVWGSNREGTSGGTNLMLLNESGNLLIGTTTDGGQKLQVNGAVMATGTITTSATNAFYIGGGAAGTSTIRSLSVGRIQIGNTASATGAGLEIVDNNVSLAAFFNTAGSFYFDTAATYNMLFRPGGSLALTLDSSQNATFAGDITVSGGNVGVGGAAESNIGASFSGMNVSTSSGYAGMVMGLGATLNATANADDLYGLYFNPNLATAAKTGLNFYGARFVGFTASGGGTINNAIGISISNLGASGTVTNAYGIDIQAQSGASTTNVAIRAAGKVMFTSLPTSSAGLPAGSLWNDSGTVKIV